MYLISVIYIVFSCFLIACPHCYITTGVGDSDVSSDADEAAGILHGAAPHSLRREGHGVLLRQDRCVRRTDWS